MTQIITFTAENDTVTAEEAASMAHVLMRRYGSDAARLARYFEDEHRAVADTERAGMWAKVAACLRPDAFAPTLS